MRFSESSRVRQRRISRALRTSREAVTNARARDAALKYLSLLAHDQEKRAADHKRSALARRIDAISESRVIKILSAIGSILIFLSISTFVAETQKREDDRVFNSWQVLNSQSGGNTGKREALEFLSSRDCFVRWPRSADEPLFFGYVKAQFATKCLSDAFTHVVSATIGIWVNLDLPHSHVPIFFGSQPSYLNTKAALSGLQFQTTTGDIPTDLRGLSLVRTSLVSSNFQNSILANARFSRVIMSDVDMRATDLSGARFLDASDTIKTDISCSVAPGLRADRSTVWVTAGRTDLSHSAWLNGEYTFGAQLDSFTSFRSSLFAYSNLRFSDAPKDFMGATFVAEQFPPDTFKNAVLAGARFVIKPNPDRQKFQTIPYADIRQAIDMPAACQNALKAAPGEQQVDVATSCLNSLPNRKQIQFVNSDLSIADLTQLDLGPDSIKYSYYCEELGPPLLPKTFSGSLPQKLACAANDQFICFSPPEAEALPRKQCLKTAPGTKDEQMLTYAPLKFCLRDPKHFEFQPR